MNKSKISPSIVSGLAIITFFIQGFIFQSKEPWTQQQLLAPADLAATLNKPQSPQPILYCIGPQAVIKNSIGIGPTVEKQNLKKLKEHLRQLPKDANIVIYCGCCPFSRCPNIRPAFNLLNEMEFQNHKLLNIPQNMKVDWIDKGYPVSY